MFDPSSGKYRWLLVGLLWLAHVIFFMNFSSLGIITPLLKSDLKLTSVQIGFLFSAVSIGGCIGALPAGLIIDRIGVRIILPLAIAMMSLSMMVLSATSFYALAFLILLIFGLFSAITGPAANKCIVGWFPSIGRATATGVKQTGVNFGGIFAGILLPYLILISSWQRSLLMVGAAEMISAVVIYRLLQDPPGDGFPGPGSFSWQKTLGVLLNRKVLALGGICFVFFGCQLTFSAYLTLFLNHELKYALVQAGEMFALSYFAGAVARIFWSLISDYYLGGRRKGILVLISWLELLSLLTLGMAAFFPGIDRILFIVMLVFGMSGIGWNAIVLTLLGETAERENIGIVTAFGFSCGYMGSLLSPPIFGYLVDRTGIFGYGWLFLACLSVATLILLSRFQEKKRPPSS